MIGLSTPSSRKLSSSTTTQFTPRQASVHSKLSMAFIHVLLSIMPSRQNSLRSASSTSNALPSEHNLSRTLRKLKQITSVSTTAMLKNLLGSRSMIWSISLPSTSNLPEKLPSSPSIESDLSRSSPRPSLLSHGYSNSLLA
ncbi:hypothetical protein CC85DRAFT_267432 [Cutaneotrichosporon oleaginosum]|uniref:Uncharacterized protein n=1 Tax=Cutaneotrichosporon oleaginosum TaxID=879819 RepID=A0A0J0XB58_9TREE|nr:uncharacterized protein CC85DRAFT_267432 [Cutaneotrichosporon oleaginosum]KLT38280.1 hypothetical protein CC85DRAFT_267432 [Cutaneotrichosporon oleaginosum]TXT05800.1 hypothetical protein COLE_07120 [Cutaneotrichosporon oleaginosum]